jgi:TolB-like protein/tRNA A-37 threonylcarbamoyl transferase component Bud32/cytochrome c-type biogenesis protein CcmH/NrfG
MAPSMIGRTLSHYRILGQLGTGGMSEVYLAEDTRLKRKVALKVLPPDLASNPIRLARFQREAEALASLSHPNIVTIYSVEDVDGVHFITMERVEGEPLSRQIPSDGMDIGRFFDLAVPLVDAVAAAHERGITHRDLKPANVMVGVDGRVHVLDFGLAKIGGETPSDATADTVAVQHTREGTILGTVPFMSPEQVQGLPVDERTDIFSLGVMFYQMLAGHPPFAGATQAALVSSILRDDPAPVSTVRTGVPDALNRVVLRCLEKPRERRHQRARDLLGDLKSARRDIESGIHRVSTAAEGGEQAIAVLAFQNMSGDPENEFFGDGIGEEIINALAQVDGLRVAARTSSFSFKGKAVEVSEIAKRLNVRHVLEGSVRKAGNRVRITAQLVEASSGYQLWSERYDRQMEDIFDVQDDIARTIVGRLKVALATEPSERLVKAATSNMEAYQLYLKGRGMLYKRGKWIALALDAFKRAVELDPGYAPAWAGLADAYMPLGYYGLAPSHETMPRALEAARRALDADPDCAEAHCALAGTALMWERQLDLAEREFQRAIALNPTYTQARCWYGLFFLQWTEGRLDAGVREIRRALDGDPFSSYATAVYAWALTTARRHSEAVVEAQLAVQRDPESFAAHIVLGHAYRHAGRYEDAVATYEAMMPVWGRNTWVVAMLALTYGYWGRPDEAAPLHQELLARRASQYVQPVMLAVSASGAGDMEAAIGFCREAADVRDPLFSLFYLNYQDFDAVRADPRFADIVARFNQPRS